MVKPVDGFQRGDLDFRNDLDFNLLTSERPSRRLGADRGRVWGRSGVPESI